MNTYVDALLVKDDTSEIVDVEHIHSLSGIETILKKRKIMTEITENNKRGSSLYNHEMDTEFDYFMMTMLESLQHKFSHLDLFTQKNEYQFLRLMRDCIQLFPKDSQFSEHDMNDDDDFLGE